MSQSIPFEFERTGFKLQPLEWKYRYFNTGRRVSPQGAGRYDDEGIAGAPREDRWMDGPVVEAGILSSRLDSYVLTGEQIYLNLAIRHAERLVQIAHHQEGALYFPYEYTWNLHALVEFPMEVPWFSGMAQGYILGCFSRLWEVTKDDRWLNFATMVFESFLQVRGTYPLWTTDLEEGKYLWFEEYARNTGASDRAFNGHLYATWGLHDYWLATGDERAEALVDGGLTSILHFMHRWRFAGGQSFYCLTHRERTAQYHGVHIGQLAYEYNVTGDPIFLKIADAFIGDYPKDSLPFSVEPLVHLEPGTHKGWWSSGLEVEEEREITVAEATEYSWDVRGQLRGVLGASTRINVEPHQNVWILEDPGKAWVKGKADAISWGQPLILNPLPEFNGTLWSYDAETDRLSESSRLTEIPASFESLSRAKLNARHCYEISTGEHAGLWVAVSDVEIALN